MKTIEIKTFDELSKAEDEAWDSAYSTDLYLLRKAIRLFDSFLILLGAEATAFVKAYELKICNFLLWSEEQIKYFSENYHAEF